MSRELRYVKELPALSEEQKGLFRKLGIEPTWWWVEGAKTGIAIGKFFYGFSPPAVSPGETVYCTLIAVAKNFIPLGDPLRGYFGIKYNGTEIARVEQEFYGLTSAITAGSFKMPDKDVTVTFFGGHEKEETTFWGTHRGTGEWVEDFSIKVTLKRPIKAPPKPPPKKYPPRAILKIPSKGNMCGGGIKFDATGSYDPDGLIIEWKYDVEGDGKFEEDIPKSFEGFIWGYEKPGIFYPTLQVKDKDGLTDLDRKKIEVLPYYPLYIRFLDRDTKKPIVGAKVTIKGPDKIEWDYKEFLSRTPEYEVPKDQIPKYIIPRPAADSKIVELYSGYTSGKEQIKLLAFQRREIRAFPKEYGIGLFTFPVKGVKNPPQYNIEYTYVFSHPDYGEHVGIIKHDAVCIAIWDKFIRAKGLPPVTCTQLFKVETEEGEPVGAATITVKGVGKKITDAEGKTRLSLTEGTTYTAVAEKEGYECVECEKTFTACTPKRLVFILKKPPAKKCSQLFMVKDKVTGASIAGFKLLLMKRAKPWTLVTRLTTDKEGKASATLDTGTEYMLTCVPLLYRKLPGKIFTACTEKPVVLELETCIQSFKVVDKETGKPLQGIALSIIDSGIDMAFAGVLTDENGEASVILIRGFKYYILTSIYKTSPHVGRYRTPRFPVFTACTEKPMVLGLESRYCTQIFKVVDKYTGTPIKDATVYAFGKKLTTDVKGEASIELPRGGHFPHVFVDAAGYRRLEKSITACTEKPVVFELEPIVAPKTCTQLFKVETEEGEPVGAATVTVKITATVKEIGKKVTDAEGKTSFVLAEGITYTAVAEKEGYECVECEKTFTACTPKYLVLTLKKIPPCTQSFEVKDKDTGAPIAGAKVTVNSTVLTTDEKGKASTPLTKGTEYTARAEAVGYKKSPDKKFTACTEKPIVFELTSKLCTQSFEVKDKDTGAPIAGAKVTVNSTVLTTDEKGKASTPLTKGTEYTARAEAVGYKKSPDKKFTACTEKPIVFELTPKRCTQLFKVETEEGEPVGAATITVKGVGKKITDAEGKTRLSLTEGTTYTAVAEKEGYECVECEKTFTACTPKRLVFILRPVKKVIEEKCTQTFKVVDEKGEPVIGAAVRVNRIKKGITDSKGKTRIELIIGKKYKAIASAWGFDCLECGKEFTACTDEIELSLKRKTGRCAQGFGVIDEEEKKPIGGATISVYEGDKLVRSATTKKDGRWALWLDWWKTYIVKVTKEGYKDYEKEFVACTERRLILMISKK